MAWRAVPRAEHRLARLLLWAAGLQLLAAELRGARFGIISDRYILIPAVLSIPWAAAAMNEFAQRISAGRTNGPARLIRRWIVPAVLSGPMIYACLQQGNLSAAHVRAAGMWLAGQTQAPGPVLCPHQIRAVAFYADRPCVWPFDDQGVPHEQIPQAGGAVWLATQSNLSGLSRQEREFIERVRISSTDSVVQRFETPNGSVLELVRLKR
jgi:hypothetical protein